MLAAHFDALIAFCLQDTADTLISMVDNAETAIDITVMYWNLVAEPEDDNFTQDQLDEMGAQKGMQLYQAFKNAASRGVQLRFLQVRTRARIHPFSQDYRDIVRKLWL